MQPRLIKALLSLSGTANQAKALADQMINAGSSDMVRTLHARIVELEAKISEMATIVTEPEPICEEELDTLTSVFEKRFSTLNSISDFRMFGYAYLRQFSPPVRLVIAKAMANRAVELKAQPVDVWLDVIAANGEMK